MEDVRVSDTLGKVVSAQALDQVVRLIVVQGCLALLVQLSPASHAFSWDNSASVSCFSLLYFLSRSPSCLLCCVFLQGWLALSYGRSLVSF